MNFLFMNGEPAGPSGGSNVAPGTQTADLEVKTIFPYQ